MSFGLPHFNTLFEYIGYGLVFVLMISVLVAAHELGHYLFARMFNMGVEEFAIGFGSKPLFTWMRRSYVIPVKPGDDPDNTGQGNAHAADGLARLEGSGAPREIERIDTPNGPALRETTVFTVRPWPLGGFVRIKGMLPEEDGSETRIPGGFYNHAPWQRFLVLLAGPLFSVLAGIAILTPIFMVDGQSKLKDVPIIGSMGVPTAASKGGMKVGDVVKSIDGTAIHSFHDMIGLVKGSGGKTLHFTVERQGKTHELSITPEFDKNPGVVLDQNLEITNETAKLYRIGVSAPETKIPLSFGAALSEAVKAPEDAVLGVLRIFSRPSEFKDSVSGPVTMVQLTARAVDAGIWPVLTLSALLSISVGIFNLLPVAPLDGGQMVLALAEMLRRGKRLSLKAQVYASGVGLTLVVALVVSVLFTDVSRLTGKKDDAPAIKVDKKAP